MHPHPMFDLSNMEFPKVLFLDHYSFPFTSMTSVYSSKHVANFSQLPQQSTAVTLISESCRNHYRSVNSLFKWAELNHMSLHPDKTMFMLITTKHKEQNLPLKNPPISIGNQTVNEVDNHKVLGVTIDCNPSWSDCHVTALCKSISKKIYQLSKIKHIWNLHARKLFVHAHIQPIIDYGSTLWDSASANTLIPLVSLHKRALKEILLTTTTLAISDYNVLSIFPSKKGLTTTREFLYTKLCQEKFHPLLQLNVP